MIGTYNRLVGSDMASSGVTGLKHPFGGRAVLAS